MEEAFHEWQTPGTSCLTSDAPAGHTSVRMCTATDRGQASMRGKEAGACHPLAGEPRGSAPAATSGSSAVVRGCSSVRPAPEIRDTVRVASPSETWVRFELAFFLGELVANEGGVRSSMEEARPSMIFRHRRL